MIDTILMGVLVVLVYGVLGLGVVALIKYIRSK